MLSNIWNPVIGWALRLNAAFASEKLFRFFQGTWKNCVTVLHAIHMNSILTDKRLFPRTLCQGQVIWHTFCCCGFCACTVTLIIHSWIRGAGYPANHWLPCSNRVWKAWLSGCIHQELLILCPASGRHFTETVSKAFMTRYRTTSKIWTQMDLLSDPGQHDTNHPPPRQNRTQGNLKLSPSPKDWNVTLWPAVDRENSSPAPHRDKKSNPDISSCLLANLHTQIKPCPHSSAFSDWILVA